MSKKICTKCEIEKDFSYFHKHAKSPHGLNSHCKNCIYERSLLLVCKKKQDGTWSEFSGKRNAKNLDRYHKTPIKVKAQHIVSNAIRAGNLIRLSCEVCGKYPSQGHHDDYAKPLTVRWLCTQHHAEWHGKNGPGANGDEPKNGENNE